MDAVSALLDGPRARGAFLLRSTLAPPWSIRIEDEAPLALVAVVRGGAWIAYPGLEPVQLREGDCAVITGTAPYTVSDDPGTAPQMIIGPGEACRPAPGHAHEPPMSGQGVRTWGNAPDGPTVLITGTYRLDGEVSGRLLRALPAALAVPAGELHGPLVTLLAAEAARDDPGQSAVLDRLLDVLLIAVLRAWFARPDADPPAWYAAWSDPTIGPALRLIHNAPSEPWTVASLAQATHVSRATLARRFHDLVGEPPMTFLAEWRIALAADLLREGNLTLAAVADQVGYGSPFALSAAFKRLRGTSPAEHRAAARSSAPTAAPEQVPAAPATR